MNIELKFRQNILSGSLIQPGSSMILAVSGGVDSMVMLDLFIKFKQSSDLDIVVVHVNHGLRGEASDKEEELVKKAAARYGVPFASTQWNFDGNGNLQDEARCFRLNFLIDMAKQHSAKYIATGHNQDDQVETVLLHLLRGSGLKGLCGISWRTDIQADISLIRPLLNVSRMEISDYAKQRDLEFAVDVSNLSNKYTRNEIRNKFLPQLEKLNPNIRNNVAAMADRLREDEEALDLLAQMFCQDEFKKVGQGVVFTKDAFKELLPAVRKRVIMLAYEFVKGSRANLNSDQIARMDEIAQSSSPDGTYYLPDGFWFEKRRELLCILK